jgi:hypothetical protein
MSDDLAIARQRRQDREYIAACKAAGIAPEAPSYFGYGTDPADLDYYANMGNHGELVPLKELTPGAEAGLKLLDLIIPAKSDIKSFVEIAGRRVLVLCWMLGRRPEPLAEMARQLGISRASLSTYARELEDRTGLHSRGQKASGTRTIYANNARKSWKLRRLNSMMAEATTENKTPASAEPAGVKVA